MRVSVSIGGICVGVAVHVPAEGNPWLSAVPHGQGRLAKAGWLLQGRDRCGGLEVRGRHSQGLEPPPKGRCAVPSVCVQLALPFTGETHPLSGCKHRWHHCDNCGHGPVLSNRDCFLGNLETTPPMWLPPCSSRHAQLCGVLDPLPRGCHPSPPCVPASRPPSLAAAALALPLAAHEGRDPSQGSQRGEPGWFQSRVGAGGSDCRTVTDIGVGGGSGDVGGPASGARPLLVNSSASAQPGGEGREGAGGCCQPVCTALGVVSKPPLSVCGAVCGPALGLACPFAQLLGGVNKHFHQFFSFGAPSLSCHLTVSALSDLPRAHADRRVGTSGTGCCARPACFCQPPVRAGRGRGCLPGSLLLGRSSFRALLAARAVNCELTSVGR